MIIVVCYFSMNDVPTFLYISINSLILPMISKLMLAFYSQFRQSFVRFINKSVCAGQVTKASIAMPIKIVQFSQHNLSMKKANVNNKTIEGLQ